VCKAKAFDQAFCAVEKGTPLPVDYDQPQRVAEAVAACSWQVVPDRGLLVGGIATD
jgi:lipoate synthase